MIQVTLLTPTNGGATHFLSGSLPFRIGSATELKQGAPCSAWSVSCLTVDGAPVRVHISAGLTSDRIPLFTPCQLSFSTEPQAIPS